MGKRRKCKGKTMAEGKLSFLLSYSSMGKPIPMVGNEEEEGKGSNINEEWV